MRRSAKYLWISVFILLILNLALLFGLNLVRLTAVEVLSKIENNLDSLANEVIVYNIEVNQAVPIKADVPFNQTMEIPINTVIPIDQTMTLPFQTGNGEIEIDMPVKTDFPVDMVVPVQFNEAISVDTVVQLNTTVPVEINIAQTPLFSYLQEAKQNVAQLRSRLALPGEATTAETLVSNPSDVEKNENSGLSSRDSQSQTVTVETATITAPDSVKAIERNSSSADTPLPVSAASTPQSNKAAPQLDLGFCAHAYWPLRPGTIWSYNSPDTSYTQRVGDVLNNQVQMDTQYEGQPIPFNLTCYQEGLGGHFLGDMRRITELGDLNFSNPRGMFLPRPEVIEKSGASWTQEYDVTGTVKAYQGNDPVVGQISQGMGTVTYTPTGFEILETPLGPREALRLEQKLEVQLEIDFDLGSQVIPATEVVKLTTIFWYAKGIGPVRLHWQGGTIQQDFKINNTTLNRQYSIQSLAEEHLVSVCILFDEESSSKCLQLAGISDSDLTIPPESELEIQDFILPDTIVNDITTSNDSGVSDEESVSVEEIVEENGLLEDLPTGDDGNNLALIAYIDAAAALGEKITETGEKFAESAIAYSQNELTLAEFRDEFSSFAPNIKGIIQEFGNLVPPADAELVHQKLVDGLDQCDQAVDLMDAWFDNPDSSTKEAAALLVASCISQINAAGEELQELVNEN